MKSISYNVNGIRAAETKGLSSWLLEQNADLIALQETKAFEHQFDWSPFQDAGYCIYTESAVKPGYSGVAVLSRQEPLAVVHGVGESWIDNEGRVLRLDFKDFSFMSVYMPSGSSGEERQAYKMKFLEFFGPYAQSSGVAKELGAFVKGLAEQLQPDICHRQATRTKQKCFIIWGIACCHGRSTAFGTCQNKF